MWRQTPTGVALTAIAIAVAKKMSSFCLDEILCTEQIIIGWLVQCGSSFPPTLQCIEAKLRHFFGDDYKCDKFSGHWECEKKDSQLPMSVPSSLLEASCLRDLEHNCSEGMIIMIMIMMTRKKIRSRLSFPNHEQKTTAFPLAGRHLLEVENCKIASFFYGFPLPSKLCLLSLTQLVSNRLDGMYILMRSSENIFHLSLSLFPLSLS